MGLFGEGEELNKLKGDVRSLEKLIEQEDKLIQEIRQKVNLFDVVILRMLTGKPFSAKLTIEGVGMPATIQVGGTGATAVFTEFDGLNGTGNVAQDGGPVAFASSAPAVATVDPASGAITAVAPGTATISGTDSANQLTASDTVTVTAGAPQSATLVVTANPPAAPAAPAAA